MTLEEQITGRMRQAGQMVLFRFPQTDLEQGKLPALLLAKSPGEYDGLLEGPA